MNAIDVLGGVIRETRLKLGLTQSQVAEKAGVELPKAEYSKEAKERESKRRPF